MAINLPNLPYVGVARQNDNYFKLLTANSSAVPYEALGGYFNFFTDQVNDIYTAIAGVNIGNLPGINDPSNASKILTTNGAGTQSWVFVQASNILISSITGDRLAPQTITTPQLGNACITPNQLASDAVTAIKILNGNVTNSKLADEAVTEAKIEDEAVTETKIADDAVTTDKILDANVTTDKILNANVTTAKLADDSVTTDKILNDNVTTAKLAGNAVTAAKIANNTITANQIDPAFLVGAAVKADQITATSTVRFANPAVQQHHPSANKFSCEFDGYVAGTNPPRYGYNVSTVTMNSTGDYTITFTTPFANANYAVSINSGYVTNSNYYASASIVSKTTTQLRFTLAGATSGSGIPIQGNSAIVCVIGTGLQ